MKKIKFDWSDVAIIVGGAIASLGVILIDVASGVIVAGTLILVGGAISAMFGGDAK